MLSRMIDWAEYAGMVLDLILMLRIQALKLRGTYLFITLFALLNLFYDGVGLAIGIRSPDFQNISVLSNLIFAVVLPLAAWDAFEEAKSRVEPVRKLAMLRMMQTLVFVFIWGFIVAAFTAGDDEDRLHFLGTLALVVWAGSIAAALAFFWALRRGIKANAWELPGNTTIWSRYFQLLLTLEGLGCLVLLGVVSQGEHASKMLDAVLRGSNLVLELGGIALTAWCVLKLRAVPRDVTDVSVDVSG